MGLGAVLIVVLVVFVCLFILLMVSHICLYSLLGKAEQVAKNIAGYYLQKRKELTIELNELLGGDGEDNVEEPTVSSKFKQ